MKKLIKKWLEKMAQANKESFGTGPLDCCELGRKSNNTNVNTNKAKK